MVFKKTNQNEKDITSASASLEYRIVFFFASQKFRCFFGSPVFDEARPRDVYEGWRDHETHDGKKGWVSTP